MDIEAVERRAMDIDNGYFPKIHPLTEEKEKLDKWLETKPKRIRIPKIMRREKERSDSFALEIYKLEQEKKGKILDLYQGEGMVASSLEKLSLLRHGHFVKQTSSARITTTITADSKTINEEAYYCQGCKLWIVGSPRNGNLRPFGPYDYYFCRICDSQVGSYTLRTRHFFDRQYRP